MADTHTPRFVGRAIVALFEDPAVMNRTGQALKVGELAQEYGFKDIDGSQPEPYSIPEGSGE